jgi:ubiquitin carboxyl-terminal hydrolase 4/11
LIGAGATPIPTGGGGVVMTRTADHLALGGVALPTQSTINPADLDKPPAYREQLEDDDSAPLLTRDAVMNDGLEVHSGIEDEGIDMTTNGGYSNFNNSRLTSTTLLDPSWSFSNLDQLGGVSSTMMNTSGNNSDIGLGDMDDRSDIVQHNSSASEGSRKGRIQDFENAEVDPEEWEEPPPVPDLPEEDQMDIYNLRDGLMPRCVSKSYEAMEMVKELKVPAAGATDEESEEEATEIHLEEGEGFRAD